MTLVSDAVDEMIGGFKNNPVEAAATPTWNNLGINKRGIMNLRLDFTVAEGQDRWEAIRALMVAELEDLVVNGDLQSEDPFLTAFEGEKKRGQKLTDFIITSAILEDDDTLFFRIAVEFDGERLPIGEKAVSKDYSVER